MQFPILIGLRRSLLLDLSVFSVAISASASIFGFLGAQLIQAALLFATWALALLAWRNLRPSFQMIRLERNGHIFAIRVGETDFSRVALQPFLTIHTWLTLIRLKTDNGSCETLVVTVDSLKNVDFRHLRMFLRWQADFSVPDDDA